MKFNTNTTNTSFINMWHQLQDFGVENSIEILGVKNENLVDFKLSDFDEIDDADVKNELYKAVIQECKDNIWFFFRECIRISNPFTRMKNLTKYYEPFVLTPKSFLMIHLYSLGKSYLVDYDKLDGSTTTLNCLKIYEGYIKESMYFNIEEKSWLQKQKIRDGSLYNILISNNRLIQTNHWLINNSKDEDVSPLWLYQYASLFDKEKLDGMIDNTFIDNKSLNRGVIHKGFFTLTEDYIDDVGDKLFKVFSSFVDGKCNSAAQKLEIYTVMENINNRYISSIINILGLLRYPFSNIITDYFVFDDRIRKEKSYFFQDMVDNYKNYFKGVGNRIIVI